MEFDPASQQYLQDSGDPVPRADLLAVLNEESAKLRTLVPRLTKSLTEGDIELGEWQAAMIQLLKDSNLRTGMLGAGGEEQMGSEQWGMAGFELKDQYAALSGFTKAIEEGVLTADQILSRAALYGGGSRQNFFATERLNKALEGYNFGRRTLDVGAANCPDCINYQSPDWVRIEELIPPGHRCVCRQNCRCRVVYKRDPNFPPPTGINIPPAFDPAAATRELGIRINILIPNNFSQLKVRVGGSRPPAAEEAEAVRRAAIEQEARATAALADLHGADDNPNSLRSILASGKDLLDRFSGDQGLDVDALEKYLFKQGLSRRVAEEAVFEIDFSRTLSINDRALIERQAYRFYILVNAQGMDLIQDIGSYSERAYANPRGILNVGEGLTATTLFHEMAHFFEFSDIEIERAAIEWRDSRATGQAVPLGYPYNPEEIAVPGDFFHPYVGRDYDGGIGTEVISMGLQHFSTKEDMLTLNEIDQGHFVFMLGLIQRARRGSQ